MGLNIIESMALGAIRGLLNGHISRFTPIELQQAITENRSLWGATSDDIRSKITFWKNKFRRHFNKYFNQITIELLVEWLRQDQPRLHSVIMSSSINYNWFNNQVERFVDEIKNI